MVTRGHDFLNDRAHAQLNLGVVTYSSCYSDDGHKGFCTIG